MKEKVQDLKRFNKFQTKIIIEIIEQTIGKGGFHFINIQITRIRNDRSSLKPLKCWVEYLNR